MCFCASLASSLLMTASWVCAAQVAQPLSDLLLQLMFWTQAWANQLPVCSLPLLLLLCSLLTPAVVLLQAHYTEFVHVHQSFQTSKGCLPSCLIGVSSLSSLNVWQIYLSAFTDSALKASEFGTVLPLAQQILMVALGTCCLHQISLSLGCTSKLEPSMCYNILYAMHSICDVAIARHTACAFPQG